MALMRRISNLRGGSFKFEKGAAARIESTLVLLPWWTCATKIMLVVGVLS